MSKYTSYLKLKINDELLLDSNDLIPSDIIDSINIKNYLFLGIRNILINKQYYAIFVKNKYSIKNKYNFFVYFNIFKNTLLYKLINFYYIIYNNYNSTLKNKQYNNYKVNWECNYGKKYIKSFVLSDLYLKRNTNEKFFNIINIAIELWNDVYLFYLGVCSQCDISNNYVYSSIVTPYSSIITKNTNFFNFIDTLYKEELENHTLDDSNNISIKSDDSNKYGFIFQYVEVKDNDDFEFNFEFLKNNKGYPDTILKEKGEILKYTLNDNSKISIIGWYISTDYTTNKKEIDIINYNNTISIDNDEDMYIYVLFENI